jgi:hypothetical protein
VDEQIGPFLDRVARGFQLAMKRTAINTTRSMASLRALRE